MNKEKIRELRSAIAATLEAFTDTDILFEVGNAKYDDSSVTFQLKCVETGGNPEVSIGEVDFKKYCSVFGLKPEDYGKQFESQGKTFTVCGIKIKNRKYPIICESGGTKYKLEYDRVIRGLSS